MQQRAQQQGGQLQQYLEQQRQQGGQQKGNYGDPAPLMQQDGQAQQLHVMPQDLSWLQNQQNAQLAQSGQDAAGLGALRTTAIG